MESNLDDYIAPNKKLDASKIIKEWFPEIKADIFISHSHKDEELAIGLSGWLQDELGLTSFIDSCVWGYSNDLLKTLDNEYCKNQWDNTYSYQKRNHSTSHVHMMLSTALSNMIDNCECLIFLNTPSSISTSDIDDSNKTDSPWIFSEIVTSKLIKNKKPERLYIVGLESIATLDEAIKVIATLKMEIEYDANLNHLVSINDSSLKNWRLSCLKQHISKEPALDELYRISGLHNGH